MKIVALGQALIHAPVEWPQELLRMTQDADAVFCNFEGCLPPDDSWPMKSKTIHAAHPQALAMLRGLGVTHLSIANNHVWDFGHAGVIETRRQAEAAGFSVAGAGASLDEAIRPAVRNGVALIAVDAGPTPDWAVADASPGVAPLRLHHRLGLPAADVRRLRAIAEATGESELRRNRAKVGYDKGQGAPDFYGLRLSEAAAPADMFEPDAADLSRLADVISSLRPETEIVMVSVHYHRWHPSWSEPPVWLRGVSEALAGAGADAVLCTGPPFAYAVERVGGAIVAPGLGNLVFHTRRGPVYDALGLPVWDGMALVCQDGEWRREDVKVLKPDQ